MDKTKISLFNGTKIRKIFFKNEWWFVINDVVAALTDSINPSQYFKKMKLRDPELANLITKGGGQVVPPLCLK